MGQVNVPIRRHRKMACHAATWDWRFQVREVCTDPASHGDKYLQHLPGDPVEVMFEETSGQKAARTRRNNTLLRQAMEPRRAALRQLMAGEAEVDDTVLAWVRDMVFAKQGDDLAFAAEVMGLPPADDDAESRLALVDRRHAWRTMDSGTRAFLRWANGVSPKQALVALMLARAEQAFSDTKRIHQGYLDDPVRVAAEAAFALLQQEDYALSEGDVKAKELLRLSEFANVSGDADELDDEDTVSETAHQDAAATIAEGLGGGETAEGDTASDQEGSPEAAERSAA